ncbi:tRNA 2-selenouridine synthase [Campylobacter concisus]|uniref:tRNA 2-selenouridine synthase n=1 Tax=Campylobacter concisus TaxID=199 RepID=UPI000CD8C218|nr:tRNA 2-selenouridine synthase [Campylobacter concisus]
MKKVKFIVFICLFILLPLAYFNGFIRISDLTSEQESIAKKYGGVYVFDEKLEKEIDKREEERDKYLDDFFKNNNRDFDLNDQAIMNEKLPRVLSNGKKYYVTTRDYGNDFNKKAEVPEIYLNKIIDFIGNDIFYKWQPFISMSYFYLDDNKNIIPIKTGVNYYKGYKIFGLYGDEASGIRLYKETSINISGDNYFYFIDSKFQKISNKDKDK